MREIGRCYFAFIPIIEFTGPLIKVTAGAKGVEITRWVTNPAFPLIESLEIVLSTKAIQNGGQTPKICPYFLSCYDHK